MSSVPYRSFVSSKPFLIIGPGKTHFYAHGTLLSESSPVLSKDVLGGMQETQLQTIEIKDVDGDIDDDTVMRFIEYAYTGDYTVPEPDVVQLSGDSKDLQEAFVSASSAAPEEDWWGMSSKKPEKSKKIRKSTMSIDLSDPEESLFVDPIGFVKDYDIGLSPIEVTRAHQTPAPAIYAAKLDRQKLWAEFSRENWSRTRPGWIPPGNNKEHEDYTPIFLCHARLYKFSDRYGCEDLMQLTVHRLKLTLARYVFYAQRASDVINLIQYTYTHTTEVEVRKDKLRALVLNYAVCYFRELMVVPSFQELLGCGGSFSLELVSILAEMVA